MKKQTFKSIMATSVLLFAVILTGAGCIKPAPVSNIDTGLDSSPEVTTVEKVEKTPEAAAFATPTPTFAPTSTFAPKTGTGLNNVPIVKTEETVEKIPEAAAPESSVKEFVMTTFSEVKDGVSYPQFSLKEIRVKKGDTVKLVITNTEIKHNFRIDELGISAKTPVNQTVEMEFTADEVGEFVYYSSMPGDRENGMWGTLIVE